MIYQKTYNCFNYYNGNIVEFIFCKFKILPYGVININNRINVIINLFFQKKLELFNNINKFITNNVLYNLVLLLNTELNNIHFTKPKLCGESEKSDSENSSKNDESEMEEKMGKNKKELSSPVSHDEEEKESSIYDDDLLGEDFFCEDDINQLNNLYQNEAINNNPNNNPNNNLDKNSDILEKMKLEHFHTKTKALKALTAKFQSTRDSYIKLSDFPANKKLIEFRSSYLSTRELKQKWSYRYFKKNFNSLKNKWNSSERDLHDMNSDAYDKLNIWVYENLDNNDNFITPNTPILPHKYVNGELQIESKEHAKAILMFCDDYKYLVKKPDEFYNNAEWYLNQGIKNYELRFLKTNFEELESFAKDRKSYELSFKDKNYNYEATYRNYSDSNTNLIKYINKLDEIRNELILTRLDFCRMKKDTTIPDRFKNDLSGSLREVNHRISEVTSLKKEIHSELREFSEANKQISMYLKDANKFNTGLKDWENFLVDEYKKLDLEKTKLSEKKAITKEVITRDLPQEEKMGLPNKTSAPSSTPNKLFIKKLELSSSQPKTELPVSNDTTIPLYSYSKYYSLIPNSSKDWQMAEPILKIMELVPKEKQSSELCEEHRKAFLQCKTDQERHAYIEKMISEFSLDQMDVYLLNRKFYYSDHDKIFVYTPYSLRFPGEWSYKSKTHYSPLALVSGYKNSRNEVTALYYSDKKKWLNTSLSEKPHERELIAKKKLENFELALKKCEWDHFDNLRCICPDEVIMLEKKLKDNITKLITDHNLDLTHVVVHLPTTIVDGRLVATTPAEQEGAMAYTRYYGLIKNDGVTDMTILKDYIEEGLRLILNDLCSKLNDNVNSNTIFTRFLINYFEDLKNYKANSYKTHEKLVEYLKLLVKVKNQKTNQLQDLQNLVTTSGQNMSQENHDLCIADIRDTKIYMYKLNSYIDKVEALKQEHWNIIDSNDGLIGNEFGDYWLERQSSARNFLHQVIEKSKYEPESNPIGTVILSKEELLEMEKELPNAEQHHILEFYMEPANIIDELSIENSSDDSEDSISTYQSDFMGLDHLD